MKKKLTAIFLCIALVAIAIVGASMAYFTDTKEATNTFTVGNVKIDLIESRFHREGNDGSNDTSIPDPTEIASGMKYVTDGHKAFTDEEIKTDAFSSRRINILKSLKLPKFPNSVAIVISFTLLKSN